MTKFGVVTQVGKSMFPESATPYPKRKMPEIPSRFWAYTCARIQYEIQQPNLAWWSN